MKTKPLNGQNQDSATRKGGRPLKVDVVPLSIPVEARKRVQQSSRLVCISLLDCTLRRVITTPQVESDPSVDEDVELVSLLFRDSTSKNISFQARLLFFAFLSDGNPIDLPIVFDVILDGWWRVMYSLVQIRV